MHEGQVSVHTLELGVLLLQLTQLRQVRDGHPVELTFPLVSGRLADAMFAAGLADLGTEFDLFQDADDLAFAELRFLNVETPLGGFSLLLTGSRFQGGFTMSIHLHPTDRKSLGFNPLPER